MKKSSAEEEKEENGREKEKKKEKKRKEKKEKKKEKWCSGKQESNTYSWERLEKTVSGFRIFFIFFLFLGWFEF